MYVIHNTLHLLGMYTYDGFTCIHTRHMYTNTTFAYIHYVCTHTVYRHKRILDSQDNRQTCHAQESHEREEGSLASTASHGPAESNLVARGLGLEVHGAKVRRDLSRCLAHFAAGSRAGGQVHLLDRFEFDGASDC
jgi:hypothetical protein